MVLFPLWPAVTDKHPARGSLVAKTRSELRPIRRNRSMNLRLATRTALDRTVSGFGLVDALFAMALAGMMFIALYAGLAFGFKVIKIARENTRATQIMLEKMETIRLYTWTQVTNYGNTNSGNYFLPSNPFIVPYYAVGTNSSLVYTGRIILEPSGVTKGDGTSASYADAMRKITVRVDWGTVGNTNRTRSMSTYVTRNGMQTYVY